MAPAHGSESEEVADRNPPTPLLEQLWTKVSKRSPTQGNIWRVFKKNLLVCLVGIICGIHIIPSGRGMVTVDIMNEDAGNHDQNPDV